MAIVATHCQYSHSQTYCFITYIERHERGAKDPHGSFARSLATLDSSQTKHATQSYHNNENQQGSTHSTGKYHSRLEVWSQQGGCLSDEGSLGARRAHVETILRDIQMNVARALLSCAPFAAPGEYG